MYDIFVTTSPSWYCESCRSMIVTSHHHGLICLPVFVIHPEHQIDDCYFTSSCLLACLLNANILSQCPIIVSYLGSRTPIHLTFSVFFYTSSWYCESCRSMIVTSHHLRLLCLSVFFIHPEWDWWLLLHIIMPLASTPNEIDDCYFTSSCLTFTVFFYTVPCCLFQLMKVQCRQLLRATTSWLTTWTPFHRLHDLLLQDLKWNLWHHRHADQDWRHSFRARSCLLNDSLQPAIGHRWIRWFGPCSIDVRFSQPWRWMRCCCFSTLPSEHSPSCEHKNCLTDIRAMSVTLIMAFPKPVCLLAFSMTYLCHISPSHLVCI